MSGGLTLSGDTSGSVKLVVPAVAGTNTVTVPAVTATVLTTASSGQVIPKAALPTGSVLQVVQGTTSTQTTNNTSTYADTTLTASITPTSSSSKILVLISQNGCGKTSANTENRMLLKLLRDATTINVFSGDLGLYTGTSLLINGNMSWAYLDSPATTSSVTYKTQFLNNQNTAAVIVQYGSASSSITLMEISA